MNGSRYDIIEIDPLIDYYLKKYLNINELQGYHSFGKGYLALWQEEFKDETSMEITVYAGADFPIFIDSKVIILNEDAVTGESIDIDMNELRQHFNINRYWALVKRQLL